MDNNTLDALNSSYVKIYQDENGNMMVGISMQSIIDGDAFITVHQKVGIEGLDEVVENKAEVTPNITITKSIRDVYNKYSLGDYNTLCTDIYNYLEVVAECWSSSNKTASAVTGSLIGKASKPFTELNEKLFRTVGTLERDTYLKELIKCNMSQLEYFWGKNKQ
jgi:hypothetical protein